MKTCRFLAFDIGASSGRALLAETDGRSMELREILRFPNAILELHGKYYWDIYALFRSLKEGFAICADQNIPLTSAGIDTWGVDFGYIGADGTILGLPRAYRDPYTDGVPESFFYKVPREEVYRRTGIQVLNFNTLFQLYAARCESFAPFEAAAEILFMPDLLAYMLTGNRVCEYTDASTSQLLDPSSRRFDRGLLEAAGVSSSLLRDPVLPGVLVGTLTSRIAAETGAGLVPVVAVAGHDTASAVAAVPAADGHFAYLSSGTWSLMGIEADKPIITEASYEHNFTNEGGVGGTVRFLKNITGMWLLEQCMKEWKREGKPYTYDQIVEMAAGAVPFRRFVYPDDPSFANPPRMTEAIAGFCMRTGQPVPVSDADFVRCIFESLAMRYGEVLRLLREMAPFPVERLHIIGGGSRNRLLNRFTASAAGVPVVAGPPEATALGNVLVQARTAGLVSSLSDMRRLAAAVASPETFLPEDPEAWETAYADYRAVAQKSTGG